jgi:hypothetical protein
LGTDGEDKIPIEIFLVCVGVHMLPGKGVCICGLFAQEIFKYLPRSQCKRGCFEDELLVVTLSSAYTHLLNFENKSLQIFEADYTVVAIQDRVLLTSIYS